MVSGRGSGSGPSLRSCIPPEPAQHQLRPCPPLPRYAWPRHVGSSCPRWTEADPPPQSKHCSVTVQISKHTAAASPAPGISPMFSSCSLGVHQGSEGTKQYRLPRPAGVLVSVGVGAACGVQSLPAYVMVQLLAQMQTHPKTLGVCQTFSLLFVCKMGRAERPPNIV